MKEPSVIHNTFVMERSYPVTPDSVFGFFSDPVRKRLWFGENENHDTEQFELDFQPGGMERVRYRFKPCSPFPGTALTNESMYLDIVPGKRIVMASTMTLGEKRISSSLVTFEFLPAEGGADLIFTHQGAFFEGSDGPEMRQGGWRILLDKLAAICR